MLTTKAIKGLDSSSSLFRHYSGQPQHECDVGSRSWHNQTRINLLFASTKGDAKLLTAVRSTGLCHSPSAKVKVQQRWTTMGIDQQVNKAKFHESAIQTIYWPKEGGRKGTVFRAAKAEADTVGAAKSSKEESIVLLKEWKVMVDALAAGDQIFILRKGGIHERAFTPPSSEFLFFPGFFHATPSMLKPEFLEKYSKVLDQGPQDRQLGDAVELTTLARCTRVWSTKDPDVLSRLHDLHIWTDEFLQKRLAWKVDRPLTILELRVTPLLRPVRFEYSKEHGGCKSWLTTPVDALSGHPTMGEPCLSDAQFAEAQLRLRERLEGVHLEWQSA